MRLPEENEQIANMLLIQKGAIPIDFYGNKVELSFEELLTPEEKEKKDLEKKIKVLLLNHHELSSKDIITLLALDWSGSKMKAHLRKMPFITETKKKNKLLFLLKERDNTLLFNDECDA